MIEKKVEGKDKSVAFFMATKYLIGRPKKEYTSLVTGRMEEK